MEKLFQEALKKTSNINIMSELISKKIFNLPKFFTNKDFRKIFDKIFKVGGEVALVGGVVRSILLNEDLANENLFFDLATNLNSEKLIKIFSDDVKYLEEGLKHGTVIIKSNNFIFEVTTLRKDMLSTGRYSRVIFQDNWKEDAARRDLTINSIYLDLKGNIFDPNDGVRDLMIGKVEFIGNITDRIKEDYLRLLRYVRFFSKYSKYKIAKNRISILKQYSCKIDRLSKERIIEENRKIFSQPIKNCYIAAEIMRESNLDIECYGEKFDLIKLYELKKLNIEINWIHKVAILLNRIKNFNLLKNLPVSSLESKIFENLQISFTKEEINSLLSNRWQQRVYYLGEDVGIKLLISIDLSQRIKKRYYDIINFKTPKFPLNGDDLINIGFKQGKEIGKALNRIEKKWVNSNFMLTKNELLSDIRINA